MTAKKYINLFLVVLLSLVFGKSQAQNSDSIDNRSKRTLQYLDINLNDEISMFKISPQYWLSRDFVQLDFSLSYEVKLSRVISFSLINKLNYYNSTRFGVINGFTNTTSFNFRYYYLMNRKIKERISGNNLNGLYMEAGFNDFFNIYLRNPNYSYIEFPHLFELPSPSISLGLQKRINKWAFFDVFLKSGYNLYWNYYYSGLGFQIGLAL